MKRRRAVCVVCAGLVALYPLGATTAEGEAALKVDRAASEIKIDGRLDEAAWADALKIPLLYEWSPGDNVEPPVATECLVTYDDSALYVAFRAHDAEPSEIRAHLMDRDLINTSCRSVLVRDLHLQIRGGGTVGDDDLSHVHVHHDRVATAARRDLEQVGALAFAASS